VVEANDEAGVILDSSGSAFAVRGTMCVYFVSLVIFYFGKSIWPLVFYSRWVPRWLKCSTIAFFLGHISNPRIACIHGQREYVC
jgi:hypothetical protein